MHQEIDIDNSQEALSKALDRAKLSEDKDLAAQIRDLGERLIRILYGLIKMVEIHSLDNDAFVKPSEELSSTMLKVMELLGAIHIVAVEDQVFVNDIRIRFTKAKGGSGLSEALKDHQVGGLSFHQTPTPVQVRQMVGLFAAEPADVAPRAALIESFANNQLGFIDLMGIYRFRISGESAETEKDMHVVSQRASSLVEEAWDNLGAERTPNPLPLRRAVVDILESSKGADASGLLEDATTTNTYGDHSLQVCRLSLLLAETIGLSEENIQDLGVASMFHDMGYAAREGADLKRGEPGFPPPFERHGAAGARLLLRQRGFNQAKINRALTALEHHRDYNHPSGTPNLFARIVRIAEDYANMTSRRGGAIPPQRALGSMLAGAGTRYDPVLIKAFVNAMGKYPPGSILEVEIPLSLGVYKFVLLSSSLVRDKDSFATPMCKLLQLPDGIDCPPSYANKMIDLAKRPHTVLRVLESI